MRIMIWFLALIYLMRQLSEWILVHLYCSHHMHNSHICGYSHILLISYVVNQEGTNPHRPGSGCFHCDSFFTSTEDESWQKNLGLESDDAAIVISNALIDPNCSHKHLNIPALHFNDDFTERGYKAFAYALSINTSLESFTMLIQECCYGGDYDDYADRSNGLLAKALRHNRATSLQDMALCYVAFGCETCEEIKSILFPTKVDKKLKASK